MARARRIAAYLAWTVIALVAIPVFLALAAAIQLDNHFRSFGAVLKHIDAAADVICRAEMAVCDWGGIRWEAEE